MALLAYPLQAAHARSTPTTRFVKGNAMNTTKTSDPKHRFMIAGYGVEGLYVILRNDGKYLKAYRHNHCAGKFPLACVATLLALAEGYDEALWTDNLDLPPVTYKYVPDPRNAGHYVIQRDDGKVYAWRGHVQSFPGDSRHDKPERYLTARAATSWVDMPPAHHTLQFTEDELRTIWSRLAGIPPYRATVEKIRAVLKT